MSGLMNDLDNTSSALSPAALPPGTVTWNGGAAAYTDPAAWTPSGVPLYGGGTVLIQSGTPVLSDVQPNGIAIALAGLGVDTQPDLVLDNAALGPDARLSLTPPGDRPPLTFATITVQGYDTNYGGISVGGAQVPAQALTIAIAPFGQLNQEGTVAVLGDARLDVLATDGAPATFRNDGAVDVAGGSARFLADVTGVGTIALLPSDAGPGDLSFVEFGGAVSPTQQLAFVDPDARASARIDDPAAFRGVIDGFGSSNQTITLAGLRATSAYFAQIGPDFGALLLLDGQQVVDTLTLGGTHPADGFSVSRNVDGSATVFAAGARGGFPTGAGAEGSGAAAVLPLTPGAGET